MTDYFNIQPITFSELNGDFTVNAIKWKVLNLDRGITSAKVMCILINISTQTITLSNGQTQEREIIKYYTSFTMNIPNNILQAWGSDDTVIDNFVLTYSPKFIKV
jgi:hypothetical protein